MEQLSQLKFLHHSSFFFLLCILLSSDVLLFYKSPVLFIVVGETGLCSYSHFIVVGSYFSSSFYIIFPFFCSCGGSLDLAMMESWSNMESGKTYFVTNFHITHYFLELLELRFCQRWGSTMLFMGLRLKREEKFWSSWWMVIIGEFDY